MKQYIFVHSSEILMTWDLVLPKLASYAGVLLADLLVMYAGDLSKELAC